VTVDDRFTRDFREPREGQLLGTRNEIITGPVADWATDFSHLEPEWAADPYPIQDDLRERCPIARTERFGGGWLPTRYEDVAAIAYDTEHFSSRAIIMSNFRPPREIAPSGGAPPRNTTTRASCYCLRSPRRRSGSRSRRRGRSVTRS
jgi:hypothetical protein